MKMGEASATAWGCDLTYDYVKINADYRSCRKNEAAVPAAEWRKKWKKQYDKLVLKKAGVSSRLFPISGEFRGKTSLSNTAEAPWWIMN